ncbi:hypothetical protein F5X68DRAFT_214492 [Plectosphaerella plurivora]|uniref:Uncharacterized protein n=1 Tax=Plectosphaerella plurivora TaxID=936078 RepID=A0A9P8V5M8_9PEZI|nr:hypothetical protein F5X68DRAFT_214492 [Plectosphaerella plurivora]
MSKTLQATWKCFQLYNQDAPSSFGRNRFPSIINPLDPTLSSDQISRRSNSTFLSNMAFASFATPPFLLATGSPKKLEEQDHVQHAARQLTPDTPSHQVIGGILWASFARVISSKDFWLDVAIFFGVIVSSALLILMARWATDEVSGCKSRARAFFWWIFLFIGGLILIPTNFIAIPLLPVYACIGLFHSVRNTKSPGLKWVAAASFFCHNSWRRLGAKIFKPKEARQAAHKPQQPAASQAGAEDHFDDITLGDLTPYQSYQTMTNPKSFV